MSFPIPKEQQFKAGNKLVCVIPPRDCSALVKGQIVEALLDTEAGNTHTPEAFISVKYSTENAPNNHFFGYAWRFQLAEAV